MFLFYFCRDGQKGPVAKNPSNAALVAAFHELGSLFQAKNDFFKSKAFLGASSLLAELDYTVTSGKQVKAIKGIGKSSQDKIDEFLRDGKIGTIEDLKGESGAIPAPVSKEAEMAMKFM